MGIYHSSSGKKQGVAVSQEVRDGNGLVNITTKRVSDDHHKRTTTVEAHFEEHSRSSISGDVVENILLENNSKPVIPSNKKSGRL